MEKEVKVSHIIKPIYFMLFAIILEMVNFLWLGFNVTGSETIQFLPKYFILDFSFLLIFAGIIFVCPRIVSNIVFYFFIVFQTLINIINATLFKVFGDIFSFDMMKLGGEAVQAFKIEFVDFGSIIVNIVILCVIIITQILCDRLLKKQVVLKKLRKKSLLLVVFFAFFTFASASFFGQTVTFKNSEANSEIWESDQYLWENMHFKLEAYKKFGTYGFYLKSISNLIYKSDDYDEILEKELVDELEKGKQKVDITAPLYGDNLIVIMLESFEWFAIDPYNTPTLWKLRNTTGVSMENFHGKNKTNVSEAIGILGNMPKDISVDYLAKNDLLGSDYTLPNMFKEMGYEANYFHSFEKSFYNRDKVNIAMGFENIYALEDVELENESSKLSDLNLDSDFVAEVIDEMIPTDTKFMSFYTTVTTHGGYDKYNERFEEYYSRYDENLEKYKEWLETETTYVYPEDEKLEKCFRQYKSAAMDTDKMVSMIIEDLTKKNLLSTTTIVMYSDHNCYIDDIYFNIKGTHKEDFYNIYNYNIPFMIYSTKLAPEKKTEFANTYDIYPTICELYGLPYNKALTQGYSVYSPEIKDSVMASYLTGIFNENFYTLNIVDIYMTDGVTQEELNRFKSNSSLFYQKLYRIELIYKNGLAKRAV